MHATYKPRARSPAVGGDGFTLIEIMMVVGILGMVLVMAMPGFIQAVKKDPLRQAMGDIEEACRKARAAAILSGSPMELVIRAEGGQLNVVPVHDDGAEQRGSEETPGDAAEPSTDKPTSQSPAFSAHLPLDAVGIALFVNLKEQTSEARVHFYPNGTSDEFQAIVTDLHGNVRTLSLECVTALATVEVKR